MYFNQKSNCYIDIVMVFMTTYAMKNELATYRFNDNDLLFWLFVVVVELS